MAALLAEEEAEATTKKGKAAASSAGGKRKKSKGRNKATAAGAASAPHAAYGQAAEEEATAPDAELDAASMAHALLRADATDAVNTARIAASVVVAPTARIIADAAPPQPQPPQPPSPQPPPPPPPPPAPPAQTRAPAVASVPPAASPPQQQDDVRPTPDAELAVLFPWLGLGDVAPPLAAADEAHEDDHLCVVCLDGPRDTSLPGCAAVHADVLCAGCAAALLARHKPCPLCRAPTVGS